MTGADRALISSLEGFEDLQLIGRLQLEDRGIREGRRRHLRHRGRRDVVGHRHGAGGAGPVEERGRATIPADEPRAALLRLQQSGRPAAAVRAEPAGHRRAGHHQDQPDDGPAGHHRIDADAGHDDRDLCRGRDRRDGRGAGALGRTLGRKDMARLGFAAAGGGAAGADGVAARLREFESVLDGVRAALPELAALTDIEAAAYARGRFSTYYAEKGLITVFIDSTERSPTFRLFPLDTVREPAAEMLDPGLDRGRARRARRGRRSWGGRSAGLAAEMYRRPFETEVEDPYLRRAALESLKKAGDDQAGALRFLAVEGEHGGAGAEEGRSRRARRPDARGGRVRAGRVRRSREVLRLAGEGGADAAVVIVTDRGARRTFPRLGERVRRGWKGARGRLVVVPVHVRAAGDAFGIRQQMAAKMLLNAHSTAVMAKLGKVVGNTMTNVSPSNLKLIGRATFLIQSHVNDVLGTAEWVKANGAARAGVLRRGQRGPLRRHRLPQGQAGRGGADGRGRVLHHPHPRVAAAGARPRPRGSAGAGQSPRPQRLSFHPPIRRDLVFTNGRFSPEYL
ncbi:MAG: hypothetical protein MZW92_61945 [Comamonadaceae bacterium]|nr:hypothetical protein [Comamonadaceae bacterium]